MRTNYLLSSTLIGCLIFIISCQQNRINPPGIELITTDLTHYSSVADEMTIEIDIWDDIEVSTYDIELLSDSGFRYFFDQKQVNKPFHKISYEFDLSQTSENFSVKLNVTDNENNISKSDIKITVKE